MAVIYEIVNTINNMCYIGQTRRSLQERIKYHKNDKQTRTPFYDDIRKYGWENFTVNIIEECEVEELNDREIYWIVEKQTVYPNGYNLKIGGHQSSHHQLTREKMSKLKTGSKFTESHKKNIRESNLGRKHTEETKRKMSLAAKRRARKKVGMFDSSGNLIQKYDSIEDAARELGCHYSNVSKCCNGKRKMKSRLGDNTLRFL